jgi:hypothetical protein
MQAGSAFSPAAFEGDLRETLIIGSNEQVLLFKGRSIWQLKTFTSCCRVKDMLSFQAHGRNACTDCISQGYKPHEMSTPQQQGVTAS